MCVFRRCPGIISGWTDAFKPTVPFHSAAFAHWSRMERSCERISTNYDTNEPAEESCRKGIWSRANFRLPSRSRSAEEVKITLTLTRGESRHE